MDAITFIVDLTLIACGITLIILGIIWVRNIRVYNERKRMLDIIRLESYRLIESKDYAGWQSLCAAFDTVDYVNMVVRFWRPLKSFWPQELRDLDRD